MSFSVQPVVRTGSAKVKNSFGVLNLQRQLGLLESELAARGRARPA